jgi:S-DNA-T family DNA segregation ATPase FtsK/SpoIIIE
MSDSPVLRVGAIVTAAVLALAVVAALSVALAVVVTVWFCHRHPYVAVAVALSLTVAVTAGVPATAGLWVLAVTGALVLRTHRRAAFDRFVLRHWQRTAVYGWRWRRTMRNCDLTRRGRCGLHHTPHLGTVWSSRWTDTLTVHPLDGQDAAAFAARAHDLARAFGALSCHAHDDPTGVVRLEVRRGDPLRGPVQLPVIPARPDPTALPLGVREDGAPWTVSLDDGHILVVGAPGAGTRSVIWSLLRAVAVPVRVGTIEVWAVDGSGGVGLGVGAAMFTEVATDPQEAMTVVRQVIAGRGRRHEEAARSVRPPLLLVLHDLARWGPTIERPVHDRLVAALDLVLDYGPSLGVVVVATASTVDPHTAARFRQQITLGEATMRPDPPHVGSASVGGGPATRIRVHRVDDPEMSATAAAFPARSRVEDAPADGAVLSPLSLPADASSRNDPPDVHRPRPAPPASRRDKARTG